MSRPAEPSRCQRHGLSLPLADRAALHQFFERHFDGYVCAHEERFVRTLKEQLLWLWRVAAVGQPWRALLDFKDRFDKEWLTERHGRTRPSARHRQPTVVEAAA